MAALEIASGFSSLKTALDITKAIKDIRDATILNAKIVELQSAIMSAQEGAIRAREANALQNKKIAELEAQITQFDKWEEEKLSYELKSVGPGVFVFMLKRDARGAASPHWVCANCFENRKVSILQWGSKRVLGGRVGFLCHECQSEVFPPNNSIEWLP